MKKIIGKVTNIYPSANSFHWSLLVFRVLIALELMMAHGLKKIGIGIEEAERVPNPLHLPAAFNQIFAVSANLFFPVLIIMGLFTRLAILPILTVTLLGYFVIHWSDSSLEKDIPFMYSVAFFLLFVLGPGKFSVDYFINKRYLL